jgi:hypothetical protein
VGPKPFIDSGLVISVVAHVTAVLAAVLFAGANPFESVATQAIAVDIVSPSDVPAGEAPTDTPENPPEPPKETVPDFNLDLATASRPMPPAPQTMPPAPQPPALKPTRQQASARTDQRAPSPPAVSQGAAQTAALRPAPPPSAAMMPPPPPAVPVQPPAPKETDLGTKETDLGTKVADLFGMPLAMPDGRLGGGFDAPAYESAKVERSSVDALRARLKSCTSLPAGVAPNEKISLVVRVNLKADGTLAHPPALIEASASPKGPLLLQSVLGGLAKCQPYDMLPADKYQEWKSLDMRFTPGDLGQG